jgi:predicted ATPase/serine phosphatase RsbU (regulator of sigma subunit)/tRNA A-37 threonylcarbamoyl transferase component Bud32
MITIPGYQITATLNIATQTVVYRGRRLADERSAILKSLSAEYPTPAAIAQLRHEYEILANLDLPGVVKTWGLETFDNRLVLILEDCGGISLQEFTTNHKLDLNNFLQIAIQIAETLGQLHQNRIIHKDIKPSNVIINPQTKQVKLIDFAIASRLERETHSIANLNTLEGTLAYISPEQTGRMNRAIDYRTDFYSLGVTFYELLTDQLPFTSNDPMELVHAHIAKQAIAPHKLNSDIPLVISALVMKLLAKTAEERYQSGYGIKADLEACFEQLDEGAISTFILGQQDLLAQFEIPQKLYGREAEVATLMDAFDRVASPLPSPLGKEELRGVELMLVAGYSGIGKTSVVNEVHKPIVRQRGYFISGKFDQFKRNIPYASLIQAFRELIQQILTESEAQIQAWKEKLLATLGSSGQVIIEVIPELEAIVGKQPAIVPLSPNEAQNRFNLAFKNFIHVFTQKGHPLVIFLDDLQWADSASLNLIEVLITDPNGEYLLTIGAYRDNEVSPTHPLMQTLDEIQTARGIVNTITLQNLAFEHINQLIADTLHCTLSESQSLAALVFEKTAGNPFFLNQLLKYLYLEGFLVFDFQASRWVWNIEQIQRIGITDSVVELMVNKIQKLPEETQNILKLAACIGNRFDLNTLAIVNEQLLSVTVEQIWQALQAGLLIPIDNSYKIPIAYGQEVDAVNFQEVVVSYKFLHDRVQQAAYSLIAEEDKKETHLKIGQLLLKNTNPEELEDKIFDIVNQLNAGVEFIAEQQEKTELANLNLIAGRKAKASTAYKTAVKHLNLGIELLPSDRWSSNYDMTFSLYRECAECEYLNGNFDRSKELFNDALLQSNSEFDKADIYSIKMNLSMTQGEDFKAGIQAGLDGLRILGLDVPNHPEELQALVEIEFQAIQSNLATINIAELFDRPDLEDRAQNFMMLLLVDLWALAYLDANWYLLNFTVVKIVSLSLEYGNTSLSAFGYVTYGMTIAGSGNYRDAYELGRLALRLNEKFNKTNLIGKVNNLFCHSINPYKQHFRTNIAFYKESYQRCMECGDLTYGVWALFFTIWTQFEVDENLQTVADEAEKYLGAVQQVGDRNMLYSFLALQRGVWNLQGKTERKYTLNDEIFEEAQFLEMCRVNNFDHGINWYSYLKAQLLYLYGHYTDAFNICREAEDKVVTNVGFFPVTKYYFYYSLILTEIYPTASETEKRVYWETLQKNQGQIKIWADHCPENFLNQFLLVSAEMARISERELEAIDFYEQAIVSAKENQFIQNEALANELAAKFWLSQGKEKYAKLHMNAAYYGYQRWGAKRKLEDLEEKYSQLLDRKSKESRTGDISIATSTGSSSGVLDLATVMKASQAISGEILLNKLLSKLMKLALENAGAQKGFLVLSNNGQMTIEATEEVDGEVQLLQSMPIDNSQNLPVTIINYVERTKANVVLNDATHEGLFTTDVYITTNQPKSVLCAPIIDRGKLVGILYLENNLTTGAFTSDRLEILRILSGQAAISIENALLYQTLEQKVEERTAQLARANTEITVLNERLKAENLRMGAELDILKEMQQLILPKPEELELIADLDIAGFMEPADEVGGDYYDILHADGVVTIGIGDVTGHGLESGILMVMTQASVRTLQEIKEADSVRFLDTLNRTIYKNVQRMNSDKNLTLAILNYAEGRISISGQHEETIVVRKGGRIERIDTIDLGFPIGLDDDIADLISHELVELEPGDGVVLYTDGIPEARDIHKRFYGLERLTEVIALNWHLSAEQIKQAAIDDLWGFIGEQKVFDDITLVVLKRKGEESA